MTIYPDCLKNIFIQSIRAERNETFFNDHLSIDVWSCSAEQKAWLQMYLGLPTSTVQPTPDSAGYWKIGTCFSASIVSQMAGYFASGQRDWFDVWNGKYNISRMYFAPQIIVDFDRERSTITAYDIEQELATIVTSAHTPDAMHELGRCIRDLLTASMRSDGWELFHAAAVRVEGRILLLPEDSGAGKTSLLTALLYAGADFIASDHVFLKQINNKLTLRSFPMAVAIGLETAMQYPMLRRFINEPWSLKYPRRRFNIEEILTNPEMSWPQLPNELQFFPQELVELMQANGQVINGGQIDAIVFPKINQYQGVTVSPASDSDASRILTNNRLLPARDDVCAPWRPFAMPDSGNSHLSAKDDNIIEHLLTLPKVSFCFHANRNLLGDLKHYSRYLQDALFAEPSVACA